MVEEEIRDYLDRVSASKVLGRSLRRMALLEYLIRTEASGAGDTIKAYSIGLDVFNKPNDFDPSTDSSVRVEIGRLRTAIALFEASEMAQSILTVDIPVGTYRPVIIRRDGQLGQTTTARASLQTPTATAPPEILPDPAQRTDLPRRRLASWKIAVAGLAGLVIAAWGIFMFLDGGLDLRARGDEQPINLIIEDFKGQELGLQIAGFVKDSFANNTVVKILDHEELREQEGYFEIRGEVRDLSGTPWVSVELADLETNRIVWNHSFPVSDKLDLQDEVDLKLNGELETRLVGAAKKLLEKRDPHDLSVQQLFVLATWVSGPATGSLAWETERVDLMKIALEKDPDFGLAHSVLADKYGFLANVYHDWDTPENLERARFHASRALDLSPLDANAMFNVAQSYWHAGRHAESQRGFQRVVQLDGGNSLARYFSVVVPYWCSPVPDDLMAWALAFDSGLSRDDPIRWIVLTWIATLHTNRAEYDLALAAIADAAQIFQVGYTYMAHAMLLNKAGRPDQAAAVIRRQRTNWPQIGAAHYAGSTIPRLCTEQPNPEPFIADYAELAEAMVGRLD